MAELKPFRGLMYDTEKIKDLKAVLAPPYDVISNEEREVYYCNSEWNIIRLILGKESPKDNERNNKYTRARDFLNRAIQNRVIIGDEKPAFYLYEQEYYLNGSRKRRLGLLTLVKAEKYEKGIVLPHEKTLKKPKEDQIKLTKIAKTFGNPIFGIYVDSRNTITSILEVESKKTPLLDFEDANEIKHRLWRITDSGRVEKIVREMKDKRIYIADGHHRYETTLECKLDYAFMMLVSTEDSGLKILAAHRAVRGVKNLNIDRLEKELLKYFDVEIFHFDRENEVEQKNKLFRRLDENRKKHSFGMFFDSRYYWLTLKDVSLLEKLITEKMSNARREIDAVILHSVIIEKILGVTDVNENVAFIKDRNEVVKLVHSGEYQLALFLNPPTVNELINVANNNERMPQKSTYFYPKPLSGLVMYKVE